MSRGQLEPSLIQAGDWTVGAQSPSPSSVQMQPLVSMGAFTMVMDGLWMGKGAGEQKRGGQRVMAKPPWATLQGYVDTPRGKQHCFLLHLTGQSVRGREKLGKLAGELPQPQMSSPIRLCGAAVNTLTICMHTHTHTHIHTILPTCVQTSALTQRFTHSCSYAITCLPPNPHLPTH